jgi:hypothetical protein
MSANAQGSGALSHDLGDFGVIHPFNEVKDGLAQGREELIDGLEGQVAGLAPEDPGENPVTAALELRDSDQRIGFDRRVRPWRCSCLVGADR